MLVKNLGEIEAIAFDIDGTLYSSWSLTIRAFPYYARHCVFFSEIRFGAERNAQDFHKIGFSGNPG